LDNFITPVVEKGLSEMFQHFIYGLKIVFFRKYIRWHYAYYRLFNKSIRAKIAEILKVNEGDFNFANEEREEQALPGRTKYIKSGYYKYMLSRYLYSLRYIRNKTVLDCASGLGWGSYLLSDYPSKLVSIDIDKKALDFSRQMWNDSKLNFSDHSVLDLKNLDTTFDVVLGYELIEHLKFEDGKLFIVQTSKVLCKDGMLILSSYFPDTQEKARKSEKTNKYHLHIYTRDEMKTILAENGFSKIRFIGDFMIIAKK
jgi:2-polyprenyl-3-methyl-5-hydroxy-6-metoxy-1,4-benzoquinol methylase